MEIEQWEYMQKTWASAPHPDVLTKYGEQGWELADAIHPGHPWSSVYTFKRRKPKPAGDPLHVPLASEVRGESDEPPAIGATTSIVGPDGNRRPYIVTSVEPIENRRWHVHLDPVPVAISQPG